MQLGNIEGGCRHTTAVNWFHHNQAYHPEYGLLWHNGQCVFLTALQFQPNQSEPKAVGLSPSLTLGQFDENVIGVCWGQEASFVSNEKTRTSVIGGKTSHLCVQHERHVSVWAVSGKYPSIVCKKKTEHKIKSIPQGCLWHPRRPILSVVSNTELHLFNTVSMSWTTVECDAKLTAGCWVRDGSKFILARGSEIKVYIFNPDTQLLEQSSMSNISRVQPHLHSSIKAMVPVSGDLVAIATELPLDHIVCGHPWGDLIAKEKFSQIISTATDPSDNSTAGFPLLIPKEKIVQNPIAEMFKVDDSAAYMGAKQSSLHAKTDMVQSIKGDLSPGGSIVGGKLDQILNLMKRMDEVPEKKQKGQHTCSEKSMSGRRTQVETIMSGARSGPIDITAIVGSTRNSTVSKIESQSSDNENHTNFDLEILDGSERHPDACGRNSSRSFDKVAAAKTTKSLPETSVCSAEVVSHVIEDQLKERGPIDVTALLSSKSAERPSALDTDEHFHSLDVQNDRNEKLEAGGALDVDGNIRDESTEDVIDLTDLKANKIEGSMTKIVQLNQEKESTNCFVVGTNTQKILQVYSLQRNELEPCDQKIILPDSHRPLGVCSIPGSQSDILVLAGESHMTDTDRAFLSFSSRVEMDLKLLTHTLPNANVFHTDETYSYQWLFDELPKAFRISFDARAKNDVHISLSPENKDMDHMYEIVFGGWSNTKSVIRRCKQGEPVTSRDLQNILDPTEFTTFSIDWNGSTLQIFKDGCQLPFLIYSDTTPLDVKFLGFSTGFGSEGDFVFKNLPQKSSSTSDVEKPQSVSSSEKPTTQIKKTDHGSNPFPSTSTQQIQGGWNFKPGLAIPWKVGSSEESKSNEPDQESPKRTVCPLPSVSAQKAQAGFSFSPASGKPKEKPTNTDADLYHTDETYSYQWLFDELPKPFRIAFDVRAKNDVHIGLSPENKDCDHMYEIVIGGWGNTKSTIRRSKQGPPLTPSVTPDILDPTTFRTFIITWDGRTLQIFKDGCEIPFMAFTDGFPLDVRFLGFSTGFGSEGDFMLTNLPRKLSNQGELKKPQSASSSDKPMTQIKKTDQFFSGTQDNFPEIPWKVYMSKNEPWQRKIRRTNEPKYPFPDDADLLPLVCKRSGGDVSKLFVLNQLMLMLKNVKATFDLTSVEMEIGDKWVVLTEDSDGYVPLCFIPNNSYNIRETVMDHGS